MPENEIIPINEGLETAQAETAKEKFERERLTRRQALKRFGMTYAMAAFALFSVDDLAHMVGKAMQQRAGDNKVVEQIATEFQQAGIALADGSPGCSGSGSSPSTCQHCSNQLLLDYCYCQFVYSPTYPYGTDPNSTMYQHCTNQANNNYDGCVACWCSSGIGPPPNNNCPPSGQTQPPQGCNC